MNLNQRLQDTSQIFEKQWKANHNYNNIKEYNEGRKKHFNQMYNIQEKEERQEELLRMTSVDGRLERLTEKMNAAKNTHNIEKMNNFKNGFK